MLKEMIGLAGEMRVCAELLKKGYMAAITHGNAKATDILITGPANRFLRVEVKTSKNGKNFVTSYFPKYADLERTHPDLWVFYLPNKKLSADGDRFFLATHEQVERIQLIVNKGCRTEKGQGCDNIPLKELLKHDLEDKWTLPAELLNGVRSRISTSTPLPLPKIPL